MSSRHSVLSVNVMCEYLIPSSLYCKQHTHTHRIKLRGSIEEETLILKVCVQVYRLLLQSKDIVVEKLVQLFICEVDAELLKGVCL